MKRYIVALSALLLMASAAFAQQAPKVIGTDYSNATPNLTALNLLKTIPAPDAGTARVGFAIQCNCAAGIAIAFDDGTDTGKNCTAGHCSVMRVNGSSGMGEQGGAADWGGMPHSGRIRIFSSDNLCEVFARVW